MDTPGLEGKGLGYEHTDSGWNGSETLRYWQTQILGGSGLRYGQILKVTGGTMNFMRRMDTCFIEMYLLKHKILNCTLSVVD